MNHDRPTPSTAVVRASRAAVVASMAGAPAGLRAARRGSFIVLVVGTLALLAVVAIIYVTLGNQDLRTKAAVTKRESLDDIPPQIARYLANDVIGRDRLSTWYDSRTIAGEKGVLREAVDYPSIDWTRQSVSANAQLRFDAAGTFPQTGNITGLNAYPVTWRATDPWLASSEPTFLDFEGDLYDDIDRPFLNNRDWAQISNAAPDGRFINLFNLRNNFDAPSVALSNNLWLFDENYAAIVMTDFGQSVGGVLGFNTPAFWTARQRNAFAPVGFNPLNYSPNQSEYPDYMWADADGDGMRDSRWFMMVTASNPADGEVDLLENSGQYRYFIATRIVDLSGRVNVNTAGDFRTAPTAIAPAGITPADIDLFRLISLHDDFENHQASSTDLAAYDGIFNIRNSGGNPNTDITPAEDYRGMTLERSVGAAWFGYNALRQGLAVGMVPPRTTSDGAVTFKGLDLVDVTTYPTLVSAYADPLLGAARRAEWNLAAAQNPLNRSLYFLRSTSTYERTFVEFAAAPNPPSSTYRSMAIFGSTDLADLLAYNMLNDPAALSPLERALDGRDNISLPIASAAGPGPERYGPMRSNRPFFAPTGEQLEAIGYTTVPALASAGNDTPFVRTQRHAATDVRQRLTTISSSVSLRATRINPAQANAALPRRSQLVESEVRPDADSLLRAPFSAHAPTALRNDEVLFFAYADALLPFSDVTNSWGDITAAGQKVRTLAYGYNGPELALHTSSHMTLNMLDCYDQDPFPSRATLLIQPTFNGLNTDRTLPHEQQRFPSAHQHTLTDGSVDQPRLHQLPDARLAGGSDPIFAPAVNVYGIEAQPFVTQVSSMTVYVDAPSSEGGDVESPTDEVTIKGDIPTETGGWSAAGGGNPDFLYRVLAIKIHNPFDTNVTLSADGFSNTTTFPATSPNVQAGNFNATDVAYPPIDRADNFYYVEFAGRYFKLSQLTEEVYTTAAAAGTLQGQGVPALGDDALVDQFVADPTDSTRAVLTERGITIPAGRTVVCYAISQTPMRIQGRMRDLDDQVNNNTPNSRTRAHIMTAIRRNLGLDSDITDSGGATAVYWMPEIDTRAGTAGRIRLPAPDQYRETIIAPTGVTPPPQEDAVNLWRAVRVGDEGFRTTATLPARYWDAQTPPGQNTVELTPSNTRGNDQLVDRLRVTVGELDRKLNAGNSTIGGTIAGDPQWDKGCTIAVWDSVRRPNDPSATIPRGAIPAYCIERKYSDPTSLWNVSGTNGNQGQDGFSVTSLDDNDFTGAFRGGAESLFDWRSGMANQNITGTLQQPPNKITAGPSIETGGRVNPSIPRTNQYDENYPEIVLDNARFRRTQAGPPAVTTQTLRPADLLLVMGLGPTDTPVDATGALIDVSNATYGAFWDDVRYTTLSEALAMGLGYERSRTLVLPQVQNDIVYLYEPQPTPGGALKTPLDRGCLRLDDFAPFIDEDGSLIYEPNEERAGLGITPAMTILDNLTTSAAGFESLRFGLPGRININTAPLSVLRTIPMLSPAPDTLPAGVAAPITSAFGATWWWGLPGMNASTDIAATVDAYRDKRTTLLRRVARSTPTPIGSLDVVDFNDLNGTTPIPPNAPADQFNGRAVSTQIAAVREDPGFSSPGELFAVRRRTADPLSTRCAFNIDFLGPVWPDASAAIGPAANNARAGVDSVLYGTQLDQLNDEYKEQLAIANAALPSITTRSDTYAVWFVVRGYRRSDVTFKPDELDQPMIPSIERRFLMVVDRSNVVKLGDEPKIVLFKELPVSR